MTGRRPLITLLATATLAATVCGGAPAQAAPATGEDSGPYVTLLFSRTENGVAADCHRDDRGVARLDTTVAPYLASLGFAATGTLETGKINEVYGTCTHSNQSIMGSWKLASGLATKYGWSFVSHTATYPGKLSSLTPEQSYDETCGSAEAIDAHGLPGGHGMIAYPGKQDSPEALQADYGSQCFAWGRRYGGAATTTAAMGSTAPYWNNSGALNGGPCEMKGAACSTIPATGSSQYQSPNRFIKRIQSLRPGTWLTLQAYVLVTGTSPTDTSSTGRWDCTSPDPRLHWTNDNERYCLSDYMTIMQALVASGATVTDPLTVGVAFGRPATYEDGTGPQGRPR